jgi:hypothetical protein
LQNVRWIPPTSNLIFRQPSQCLHLSLFAWHQPKSSSRQLKQISAPDCPYPLSSLIYWRCPDLAGCYGLVSAAFHWFGFMPTSPVYNVCSNEPGIFSVFQAVISESVSHLSILGFPNVECMFRQSDTASFQKYYGNTCLFHLFLCS